MLGENVSQHRVTVNGQVIAYEYTPEAFGEGTKWAQDHFAFRSDWVSPTGYRSWFVNAAEVQLAGGHEAAAIQFIQKHWRHEAAQADLLGLG